MSERTPHQAAVYRELMRLGTLAPEQREAERKRLIKKLLQIRPTPSPVPWTDAR